MVHIESFVWYFIHIYWNILYFISFLEIFFGMRESKLNYWKTKFKSHQEIPIEYFYVRHRNCLCLKLKISNILKNSCQLENQIHFHDFFNEKKKFFGILKNCFGSFARIQVRSKEIIYFGYWLEVKVFCHQRLVHWWIHWLQQNARLRTIKFEIHQTATFSTLNIATVSRKIDFICLFFSSSHPLLSLRTKKKTFTFWKIRSSWIFWEKWWSFVLRSNSQLLRSMKNT